MEDARLVALRAAVQAAPEEPTLHLLLADALLEHGFFEDAEASYRNALRLKPDIADARFGVALALSRQNKPRDALAALDELRTSSGESSREQMLRARLAFQLGET